MPLLVLFVMAQYRYDIEYIVGWHRQQPSLSAEVVVCSVTTAM